MAPMNNKQLYETIMRSVAKEVKKTLDEAIEKGSDVSEKAEQILNFAKLIDSLLFELGPEQILVDNLKITGSNNIIKRQKFNSLSGWFNGLLIELMFIKSLQRMSRNKAEKTDIQDMKLITAKNGLPVYDLIIKQDKQSINVLIKAVNIKNLRKDGGTGNDIIKTDSNLANVACVIIYEAAKDANLIKILKVLLYTDDKFSLLQYDKKYGKDKDGNDKFKTKLKLISDHAITITYSPNDKDTAKNSNNENNADNTTDDTDTNKQTVNKIILEWKKMCNERAYPTFLNACKHAQFINKDWLFDIFQDKNKADMFINNMQEYFLKINSLKLMEANGFRCVNIDSVLNVYKILFNLSSINKQLLVDIEHGKYNDKRIEEICKFYNDKIDPYIKQIQHYIDTVVAYKNIKL